MSKDVSRHWLQLFTLVVTLEAIYLVIKNKLDRLWYNSIVEWYAAIKNNNRWPKRVLLTWTFVKIFCSDLDFGSHNVSCDREDN